MSDPNQTREVSVTIKHDGKDSTWLVFRGSVEAVREQIIECFGMTETEGLTLHELSVEATRLVKATSQVANGLGGRVLKGGSQSAFAQAREGGGSAPAPAKEDEDVPLKGMIEAATSVAALKTLWAENKAAFDADPELFAAWKAKGKSLSS